MKYLLSSGSSTDKLEYYIMDLVKLYLSVYPGDIPGSPSFGFDFSLANTFKGDIREELLSRVNALIDTISNRFDNSSLEISLNSLEIVDDSLAKLVIDVNKLQSDEIVINLYN